MTVVVHSVSLVGCVEAVVWSVFEVTLVAGSLVVALAVCAELVAKWAAVGMLVVVLVVYRLQRHCSRRVRK